MNILYICPRFPYPTNQGDKVVVYNHLKFLSKKNKITLLSFMQDEKEMDGISHLSSYCSRIEVFKKRKNFTLLNFIFAIYKSDPFTAIRYYSPKMLERSKGLIESGRFDIVHVAFYYMGQYAINKNIAVPKTTALILDTHNIEYLIYSRCARLTKNPFLKIYAGLEALRIKRYELSIYRKFDKCIAFSGLDKNNIARLSGASNVEVNPACIELPSQCEADCSMPQEENAIIYFGLLSTLANDDAIRFFYERIWPLVKRDAPDTKFIIAGKSPGKYVRSLTKDPDLRLAGYVSDIRSLLKKTALVIVPLRLGGGIRLKILESWALGKAVVSTSIGAEGLEVSNGLDIVIADSVVDFAREVVGLLKDQKRRSRIGEEGFRKATEYYSPDKVIGNLEHIYKRAWDEKGAKA
jgi:polysaccharide biosynthesis protein PslH